MKKIELIESINEQLPIKVNLKVLALFIGRAFNQIIYDTFRKKLTSMDIFTRVYKDIDVSFDSDTDTYYSVLPVQIVQLPQSGDGIMSIHSNKGRGVEFAAKKSSSRDIHSGMEVDVLDGPIPFWIEDGKVMYETRGGITTIDKVRIQLIPEFMVLDMMDDIHIPSGQDERLLELVTQFAGQTPPSKEINDGNVKTK